MITRQYAEVDRNTRQVLQCLVVHDPADGPPTPTYSEHDCYLLEEPIDWAAKPSATSVLRWVEGAPTWQESATLEELRAARKADINAWKLEANNSYFEFAGKRIAYKESDRVEIQAVNNIVALTGVMPAWADWPAAWKAMDNSWVPLPDVATWIAFNEAIGQRGTAHFKHAQVLKSELAAATTAAEIEAIQW